jgi:DNA-binding transcriptional regulator YhcF (GntR family)
MRKFAPRELAAELEMPESTLRRWCKVLEEAGYVFEREQNRRVFGQQDTLIFQAVKQQMAMPGVTLEEACWSGIRNRVAPEQKDKLVEEKMDSSDLKHFEQLLDGLMDRIYWSGADLAVRELKTAFYASRLNATNKLEG